MKKLNILLVDDHEIVIDGLKAVLSDKYSPEQIEKAHSGEDALEILKTTPIDLVLLDISMPNGIDGIETAKLIRDQYPSIKIILFTMIGDGNFIINALKVGVQGYVMKGKNTNILINAIECVMDGGTYFSPDLLSRISTTMYNEGPKKETVKLTKRELEILEHMVNSPHLAVKEIAAKLDIVQVTAEKHIQNMKDKLDISRSAELIKYAIEHNFFAKK